MESLWFWTVWWNSDHTPVYERPVTSFAQCAYFVEKMRKEEDWFEYLYIVTPDGRCRLTVYNLRGKDDERLFASREQAEPRRPQGLRKVSASGSW